MKQTKDKINIQFGMICHFSLQEYIPITKKEQGISIHSLARNWDNNREQLSKQSRQSTFPLSKNNRTSNLITLKKTVKNHKPVVINSIAIPISKRLCIPPRPSEKSIFERLKVVDI